MKNIQKIWICKNIIFFHMFDLQLIKFPPFCTACPLKQTFPIFYEYMNGIRQKGEAWWGQKDPQPCPQGDLNPDQ